MKIWMSQHSPVSSLTILTNISLKSLAANILQNIPLLQTIEKQMTVSLAYDKYMPHIGTDMNYAEINSRNWQQLKK